MKPWLRLAACIDQLNRRIGLCARWLTLVIVVMGSFNALARYASKYMASDLSSNAYIELQWYLFATCFLLGAAYTLHENAHVRVDILYARCAERTQAWIDILGTLLFLLPFCMLMIIVSMPQVINSWSILEGSPDPGGLPRYPIKTVIPIAFLLLALQGCSQAIKRIAFLRGHLAAEPTANMGVAP